MLPFPTISPDKLDEIASAFVQRTLPPVLIEPAVRGVDLLLHEVLFEGLVGLLHKPDPVEVCSRRRRAAVASRAFRNRLSHSSRPVQALLALALESKDQPSSRQDVHTSQNQ